MMNLPSNDTKPHPPSTSYGAEANDTIEKIPAIAWMLGLGGLIPFFGGAVLSLLPGSVATLLPDALTAGHNAQQSVLFAISAYGAVILSFLGGVRWGRLLGDSPALEHWRPLTLSILPSLIAWCALLLQPTFTLALLIAGFLMQYAQDAHAASCSKLPGWYGRLRLILTTGAVLSLLVALVATVR